MVSEKIPADDRRLARVAQSLEAWFLARLAVILPEPAEALQSLAQLLAWVYVQVVTTELNSEQATPRIIAELRRLPSMRDDTAPKTVAAVKEIAFLYSQAVKNGLFYRYLAIQTTEFAAEYAQGNINPLFTPAWQVAVQRVGEIHQEFKDPKLSNEQADALVDEINGIFQFMLQNVPVTEDLVRGIDEVWNAANQQLAALRAQGLTDEQITQKVVSGELKLQFPPEGQQR